MTFSALKTSIGKHRSLHLKQVLKTNICCAESSRKIGHTWNKTVTIKINYELQNEIIFISMKEHDNVIRTNCILFNKNNIMKD